MPNFKISQLEKVTNMDPDSFVLVVQNGKNYRMSIKEAINAYVDLSPYYTKEETEEALNNIDIRIDVNSVMELKDYLAKKGIDLEDEIGGEIVGDDEESEDSEDKENDEENAEGEGDEDFDFDNLGDIFGAEDEE